MKGPVYFYTLGCRLNQAEASTLKGVLELKGYRLVSDISAAEVVVVNTCTVTAIGDAETRRFVNKVRREAPQARIALIGCQAQVQKDRLLSLPGVRWVVGNERKMDLADILDQESGDGLALIVPRIRRRSFTVPIVKRPIGQGRTRANLKVQDGCDHFCAYCEIPYARGRSRSRVFSDIIAEAENLNDLGYKEVVITGINVGLYDHEGKSLLNVVKALHKIKGIERIRISSIEHTLLPMELLKFMFPHGKLCRFLHIPVQSGCDRTLKRMGRRYLTNDFASLVEKRLSKAEGLMLGTDVIVGFPGETDADHTATERFLESLPLGYVHVFSYSHRQQARSRTFKGELSSQVIAERSHRLRALSLRKEKAFLEGQLGQVLPVLFEHKKKDLWIGHSDNYVRIRSYSARDLKNHIHDVNLERVCGRSIIGSLR